MSEEALLYRLNHALLTLLQSELALRNAENACESARQWRRESDATLRQILRRSEHNGINLAIPGKILTTLPNGQRFIVEILEQTGDGAIDFDVSDVVIPAQFLGSHCEAILDD